jgi:hypothetical protein
MGLVVGFIDFPAAILNVACLLSEASDPSRVV